MEPIIFSPKIIFEDNDLLVIDKPAGIIANKAETVKNNLTVQDWSEKKLTREIFLEKDSDFAKRGGLVHRLDKETSGILLIAKNQKSLENLQSQFKERQVIKKYYLLVHGKVVPKTGTINAPIDRLPWNRQHFGVFPGGREAKTDYAVLEYYLYNKDYFTFIEAVPHTGRTHQIRVHFKYLGYPLVGDELYAGRKTARIDRKFCPRHFLHAGYLEIKHPETNELLKFNSPLPSDLQSVISLLTKYP